MKKLVLATLTVSCAVSVFAQGTVNFNMRSPFTIHIYGPSSTAPNLSLQGLGSADNPAGTVPYTADGMTLIGTAGGLSAATTLAQIIALNGAGNAESSLVPVGSAVTFRTGAASGDVAIVGYSGAPNQTFTNSTGQVIVPADSAVATLAIVAWDDSSGDYATWATASVAWLAGEIAAGESTAFNVSAIGGTSNTPPTLAGQSSFNLYFIPEPGTFALAGLGMATLLVFRRRK